MGRAGRFLMMVVMGAALAAEVAQTASAAPVEVWVAPEGQAGASGTIEAPLGSPAEALRQVREWRRTRDPRVEEGARIVLRGGRYEVAETIILRPEDSGTAAAPLAIVAAPEEVPVLSGGRPVTGWRPAETLPARMGHAPAGAVWVAEVPEWRGRPLEFRQLWVNNVKAVRARYPETDDMRRLVAWNTPAQEAEIPLEALGGVQDIREVEMVIHQMWEIAVLRLRTVAADGGAAWVTFQEPEGQIQFEHPWPPPVVNADKPERNSAFYFTNAPEYLSMPGEWWLDRRAGQVYYWPRAGEDLTTTEVIVPALETVLELAGSTDNPIRHVSFEGLTFAHSGWLRPSLAGHVPHQATMFMTEAYKLRPKGTPDWRSLDNQAWVGRSPALVLANGINQVSWQACRFTHGAMGGLDLQHAVQDTTVERCAFRDLGGNGVQAGYYGDRAGEVHLPYRPADEREQVARVTIAHNRVDDTANEDWGGVGISVGFAREMLVAHNEIVSTSYTGISLGWGWSRTPSVMSNNHVVGNHIQRFATRNTDTAGIYLVGAQPGSVVERNVIEEPVLWPWVHDPEHWGFVYLDEGSSYTTVRDNWAPREKFIKNANGPGNVWENNGPMVEADVREAAGPDGH